ncbi:MAG: hypothetical protein ACD_9C00339G0003 [uncultured bacterium]|nr:MAG: hypothetical protein ACD_9C00339G0003 [uncultured bacterium]
MRLSKENLAFFIAVNLIMVYLISEVIEEIGIFKWLPIVYMFLFPFLLKIYRKKRVIFLSIVVAEFFPLIYSLLYFWFGDNSPWFFMILIPIMAACLLYGLLMGIFVKNRLIINSDNQLEG